MKKEVLAKLKDYYEGNSSVASIAEELGVKREYVQLIIGEGLIPTTIFSPNHNNKDEHIFLDPFNLTVRDWKVMSDKQKERYKTTHIWRK
jgi:hypothetical protein